MRAWWLAGILKSLAENGTMRLSDGRMIVPADMADEARNNPQLIAIHPDFRLVVLANRPGFPFLGHDFFAALGDVFSCHAMDNVDPVWLWLSRKHPLAILALAVVASGICRRWRIARAGVTVTRLLCDPLPYKNVLKVTARETYGRKYRFSFQYKMYQAFSQILPRAVLRIGLCVKSKNNQRHIYIYIYFSSLATF
jgi:hypothetical protein